jgi:hypothetical protein
MPNKNATKIVYERSFCAEIPIELIEAEDAWSPYLSVQDATKLDAVRRALRDGDVVTAARYGRIVLTDST